MAARADSAQPAVVALPRPRRLPDRMSLLGIQAGQVIAWQLIVVAGAFAVTLRGPAHWVLAAVALAGCSLTVPRWQHRWAYEWLFTLWSFRRASRPDRGEPGVGQTVTPKAIQVTAARVRTGPEAGVAHDGDGFAVIVGVTPEPGGWPVTELPVTELPVSELPVTELTVAILATLLDPQDTMVSAVQVVLHAELAASDTASGAAAAYHSLGYHRVPRSQSAWIVLRHDPAVSGYAVGAAGTAPDLHASLMRALTGRATRAIDQLPDARLRGQLADAQSARELLSSALLSPEPNSQAGSAADPVPSRRWGSWHSPTRRHVTYWLKRWPTGGLPALQQALMTIPALSVTTAVVLTRENNGQLGLTATVSVAAPPDTPERDLRQAVAMTAASCGARLVPLHGAHDAGVLATLPLGRRPASAGRWLGRHACGTLAGTLSTVIPVGQGGVVIGGAVGGDPLAVPFFVAEGGIRAAVIGDAALPRLLALRALGAGARLQVVTSRPGGWLSLRDEARLPSERMTVVRQGTAPPSDGTRAAPWMIIDDTGSPAAAGNRPWQAAVAVLSEGAVTAAALRGLNAIVFQRGTPACVAAVTAALSLPEPAARSLTGLPPGVFALACPGTVRLAPLTLDESERSALVQSLNAA
jgi:type VII secretion protein EccE